ncbi:heparinase II/III family protein [Microbacterium excoecariae]|uniref:heparinase II/III family protein n=1 Tax=Microbacterium excoecariae TaxID=2715210 RepID=UPI001409D026|nr:heparinase II/III family protein [Microbacterium excoecariae]NHI16598.1 hypothetical protein [Microbacterium excoecariae]
MIEHGNDADSPSLLIPRGAIRGLWEAHRAAPVLAPDATDRSAWDAVDPGARAALLASADAEAGAPWPELLLRHWTAYGSDGDRLAYENPFFARSERTVRAVLAAALDPTPSRVRQAADGLWLLAEQSSWCWPAHDRSFPAGALVPDPDRPTLDLGAGEAVALVAWADATLGPLLDAHVPGIRARLRREAAARAFDPFLAERWHWEGSEARMHNWGPWILGNLLVAALALAEGDLRDRVAHHAVDGIDRYLAQLPRDGAIDEGFGYWWQGAARALDALSLIDRNTDGAVRRAARPGGDLAGLAELVRFPQRAQLGGDWYASWSDAEALAPEPLAWHALFRAAGLAHVPEARGFAAARRDDAAVLTRANANAAGLGRQLATLLDPEWREAAPGPDPLPADVRLSSIGIGIRRAAAGDARGIALIAKGGHNDEAHNQQDVGSLAIAVDGVPVLIDPGRETYTAATFSERRYDLWHTQSAWHGTALPRGLAQRRGPDAVATVTVRAHGWTMDLTAAYPLDDGELWIREIDLDGRDHATVRDRWTLSSGEGAGVYVCAGVPRVTPDGIFVPAARAGRGLRLRHDAADVRVETRRVEDPFMTRAWGSRVSRIVLASPASAGGVTVRAEVWEGGR